MRFNTISKIIAASALTCAATTALAAPVSFTLEWDVANTVWSDGSTGNQYSKKIASGTYQGYTKYAGNSTDALAKSTLCWGDPSCLALTNNSLGGTTLKHTNSTDPEKRPWLPSLTSTNLLLTYVFGGVTYTDSFAVTFNETPNTGGYVDDIFTIEPFEFTVVRAGNDGYDYVIHFFDDIPNACYEEFVNNQFTTPETGYSYIHFAMTAERIGPTGSVPEPGVLALLGIGLVGWGVSRRRRA